MKPLSPPGKVCFVFLLIVATQIKSIVGDIDVGINSWKITSHTKMYINFKWSSWVRIFLLKFISLGGGYDKSIPDFNIYLIARSWSYLISLKWAFLPKYLGGYEGQNITLSKVSFKPF